MSAQIYGGIRISTSVSNQHKFELSKIVEKSDRKKTKIYYNRILFHDIKIQN